MTLPGPCPAHHVGWSRHRPASENSRDPGSLYSIERLSPALGPFYITARSFEHCLPKGSQPRRTTWPTKIPGCMYSIQSLLSGRKPCSMAPPAKMR